MGKLMRRQTALGLGLESPQPAYDLCACFLAQSALLTYNDDDLTRFDLFFMSEEEK